MYIFLILSNGSLTRGIEDVKVDYTIDYQENKGPRKDFNTYKKIIRFASFLQLPVSSTKVALTNVIT